MVDGNYDDPRLTDYDTLQASEGRARRGGRTSRAATVTPPPRPFPCPGQPGGPARRPAHPGAGVRLQGALSTSNPCLPITLSLFSLAPPHTHPFALQSSTRTGYREVVPPPSRVVVLEGIYALSSPLRGCTDLRVAVVGGVHRDLLKRVLRDVTRSGQNPAEIVAQARWRGPPPPPARQRRCAAAQRPSPTRAPPAGV